MRNREARAPKHVFLSYTHRDAPFARELSLALGQLGVIVIDPLGEMRPGERWSDMTLNRLRSADFLVFVFPGVGGESSIQLSELGAARALAKPIVPIMLKPDWYPTGQIASLLSKQSALDASRLPMAQLAQAVVERGSASAAA